MQRHHLFAAAVTFASLMMVSSTAAAEPLVAVSNRVVVTPAKTMPGLARVTAEHRFRATRAIDRHGQNLGRVRGALVDMAFKVGQRPWKRADGLAPKVAERRFAERIGHGDKGSGPTHPAVMVSWSHGPSVTFGAIAADTMVTVRLTYEVQGQLRDGRWGFALNPGTGLTAQDVAAGQGVTAVGNHGRCGTPAGLWLSWPGPKQPEMSVEARSLALPKSLPGPRHLTMASFQAHQHLRALPRGLTLALLIDASRSAVQRHQRNQLELARAVIDAHPEATFALFAFHRDVVPITARPVRAAAARAALQRFQFPARANGSELGKALEHAARALRPAGAAGRVVVISDGRVRSSMDAEAAGKAARVANRRLDAVHVVVVNATSGGFQELTSHALDPLLAGHGGVVASAGTQTDGAELAAVLKYPTQASSLALALDGRPVEQHLVTKDSPAKVLKAGTGTDVLWLTSEARPRRLTMTGMVWRKKATWTTAVAAQPRVVARAALGRFEAFDAKLLAAVAPKAQAVSPVRSLVAAYGSRAASPRTDGGMYGLGMSGSFSTCCGVGRPIVGIGRRRATHLLGPADHVASVLAQTGAASCPGTAGAALGITVETTDDEIVAVAVAVAGLAKTQRQCLTELAWKVVLPDATASGRKTSQSQARVAAR